jgi:hypothetical protein
MSAHQKHQPVIDGGHAPSNRVPSGRSSEVRQLSAGIDTLYWSAKSEIPPTVLTALKAARESASRSGCAQLWATVDGYGLAIAPHGAGRYPICLDSAEFRLQLTDSVHLPAVYVQLRSGFIHEVGIDEAVSTSARVAEAVIDADVGELHASRVDLYADFADWVLRRSDVGGVVTNAKIATHGRAGTDELETLKIGKSPLAVRLYRKDIEVRQRGGFAPVFWAGHEGPVLRVEAQATSEMLRSLRISSVSEGISCRGDIWAWATSEFVQLRTEGPGDREDWALRPKWELVRGVGIAAFPRCGPVPLRIVEGTRARVVPALFGYLSTYAALENLRRPRETVRRLMEQYPDLTWPRGRLFSDEVVRKRGSLPRSYRLTQEGRGDLDSARDRPPSPEGGDSESSTVGDDA